MRYSAKQSVLKSVLSDFKSDKSGTFIFVLQSLRLLIRYSCWTCLNRVRFLFFGVTIGRKSTFIGSCLLKRYPTSKISFGNNCSFNSARNVNLVGVNRRCIISTQDRHAEIAIGNNCGMSGATIAAFKKISIGNNVKIGANALITDSNWHPDDPRSGDPKEIRIGNNVWLGVNSVVLKGVTIGDNCVVGANCVVSHDIPNNSIVVGNPCRVVKTIENVNSEV